MSSVKAYFAELFGDTDQAVVVLDRGNEIIYGDLLMEGLLATMSERDLASLRKGAEKCVRNRKCIILTLEYDELKLLPYPYEGEWYVVIGTAKKFIPDQAQMTRILRNAQEKIIGYLHEIYGDAQVLGLETPQGTSIGDAVRRILRAIYHLDMAIDGSGQMQYRVPMDYGEVAEAYVNAYLEVLPAAPLILRRRDADAYAAAMPENLELILGTLIGNALRFGDGQAYVDVTREGDMVRISVCDNGAGVKDPQRLFEAGYRTTDPKGVRGLGYSLFMAKRLAEQQGAALLYERRGNETCFHLEAKAVEIPSGKMLASWKPEDPDNSLSQLRIEMSDYVKEMGL